jgi:hypothetical protein
MLERLERLEKNLRMSTGHPTAGPILGDSPGLPDSLLKSQAGTVNAQPQSKRTTNDERRTTLTGALDEIISTWPAVLSQIKDKKISAAMYLKEGLPLSLESDKLLIEFPKSSQFHMEMLDSVDCKSMISKAIKDISGFDVKVKFILSESDNTANNGSKEAFESSLSDPFEKKPSSGDAFDEPIISDALQIFGGELEKGKKENRGK